MPETGVERRSREAYSAKSGSKMEVLAAVNKDKDPKNKINIKQVRQ